MISPPDSSRTCDARQLRAPGTIFAVQPIGMGALGRSCDGLRASIGMRRAGTTCDGVRKAQPIAWSRLRTRDVATQSRPLARPLCHICRAQRFAHPPSPPNRTEREVEHAGTSCSSAPCRRRRTTSGARSLRSRTGARALWIRGMRTRRTTSARRCCSCSGSSTWPGSCRSSRRCC